MPLTVQPLEERAGEWINIFEAVFYCEKDSNTLKLESKKPIGDGQKGTTPLISKKESGKPLMFQAESLMAYMKLNRKRGGFGRTASADGKKYFTSAIKPSDLEAVKAYLSTLGIELIDPTVKAKEAAAKRKEKTENELHAVTAAG